VFALDSSEIFDIIASLAQLASAILLVLYVIFTYGLRKENHRLVEKTGEQIEHFKEQLLVSEKSSEFNAYAILFNRFNSTESYRKRTFLYRFCRNALGEAVKRHFGDEYIESNDEGKFAVTFVPKSVSLEKHRDSVAILTKLQLIIWNGNLQKSEFERKSYQELFNQELRAQKIPDSNSNVLEVIETILLDMDIVSGPAAANIPFVKSFAEHWRPLFKDTARVLLPFVIIQRALRNDPEYKKYYLQLLVDSDVLEKQFEVPL